MILASLLSLELGKDGNMYTIRKYIRTYLSIYYVHFAMEHTKTHLCLYTLSYSLYSARTCRNANTESIWKRVMDFSGSNVFSPPEYDLCIFLPFLKIREEVKKVAQPLSAIAFAWMHTRPQKKKEKIRSTVWFCHSPTGTRHSSIVKIVNSSSKKIIIHRKLKRLTFPSDFYAVSLRTRLLDRK